MTYDYSKSGLPKNAKWERAAEAYHAWVTSSGFGFNGREIANFMKGQPVAAAKRIIDNCPDYSEESVTLILLGQVKGDMLTKLKTNPAYAIEVIKQYDERTLRGLIALAAPNHAVDAEMSRDVKRIIMAESMSMMEDQLIGREKMPVYNDEEYRRMHGARRQMLAMYEHNVEFFKDEKTQLYALYVDFVDRARQSIEAVEKKTPVVRPQRKPGHGGGHPTI